jgi:galactokinase
VKHELASGEYNRRQEQCAAVLQLIRARRPEVKALRDATMADLEAVAATADAVGLRRCRHVLTENERVHEAVAALGAGDGAALRRLFAASHRSLRDDYEVSCRELDAMVEAAERAPGFVAGRMTGGGFGGATVNLVQRGEAEAFAARALEEYRKLTGREGRALVTAASDGARVEVLG